MDKPEFKKTVEELVIINHIEKINLGDLQLKKKIGEGGQAKVYKGTYKDKQIAIS